MGQTSMGRSSGRSHGAGRAFQDPWKMRPGSNNRFEHERKISMSATTFFSVRLHMKKIGCSFRLSNQQSSLAIIRRIAWGIGVAVLLTITGGIAAAQNPTPAAPLPKPDSQMTLPDGYSIHSSVDVGGRIADISGSKAMYDT